MTPGAHGFQRKRFCGLVGSRTRCSVSICRQFRGHRHSACLENYAVRKSQSNANRYSAQFESHRHVSRELNSLYVHEPELSTRVSRRQCTAMRCVVDLVVCITGQAAADAAKILRRVVEGDVGMREQIPHVNLVDSTGQRLLSTRCAATMQNRTRRRAGLT